MHKTWTNCVLRCTFLAFPAVRSVAYFALIVSLAIYAIPSTAQELPFTIGCMADKDKALEMALCQAVFAAARAHEFMRESTQDDYASLMLWVVPLQIKDQGVAVAVQLNLSARSFEGAEMALNTSCYFAPADEFPLYAAAVISRAYLNAPKDLSVFEPEPVNLHSPEASPP